MRRPSPYANNKDINDPKKKLETLRRNSDLKQKALQNGKAKLIQMILNVLVEYRQVQKIVIENLQLWKNEGRKNGYGNENDLITIQGLFEDLADIIIPLKQNFEQISWESTKRLEILRMINTCLHNLITSSFVVVKQPLQVKFNQFLLFSCHA